MFKIYFYVPQSHLDQVKTAMFEAGAGKIGNYSHCAWQVLGEGQFMPETGSNPFIGKPMQAEMVLEYKVEMVCEEQYVREVIKALKNVHPYEEPAYQVIKTEMY